MALVQSASASGTSEAAHHASERSDGWAARPRSPAARIARACMARKAAANPKPIALQYRKVESQYIGRQSATSTHRTRRAPAEGASVCPRSSSDAAAREVTTDEMTWNTRYEYAPHAWRRPQSSQK